MTLEEAKKILESEGFDLLKTDKLGSGTVSEAFTEYENPEICEAMQTVCCAGYKICMFSWRFDERKARLKMECEKNTKAPGPGEEQSKEKKGIIYPSTFPKADFYYKHVLNEGNPALEESASQFNDALLNEQAKEIESLRDKCKKLVDIIDSVRDKLRKLKAENRRIKNSDLNLEGLIYATRELEEKNKKIAELTKDKELIKKATLSQLDDFIEIYNLLTKESQKTKRLGKEIAKLNGIIHDKNAILSDVAEELRLSKIREKNLTEVSQKYMKENEELKNELDAFKVSYKRRIKEDSEHFEHIQKICNVGLQKWLLESEYLEKDKPFRFSNYDIARGKENKKPRISTPEEPKQDNGREDFIKKAIDSFNIRAANLGSVGSKDGNGIIDQMIGVDIAEEGGDHSAIIAQCCKNIAISKEEAKIIERCTKNGTELHYSEKDGFTYTNMYGEEMPIRCLRGMFHVFTDEGIKNMKK